jgi:hypothetical protein
MKSASTRSSGSNVHIRARICDAGLYAATPRAVPSDAFTNTVAPGAGLPSTFATAPLNTHGCRRTSERSRFGRSQRVPDGVFTPSR